MAVARRRNAYVENSDRNPHFYCHRPPYRRESTKVLSRLRTTHNRRGNVRNIFGVFCLEELECVIAMHRAGSRGDKMSRRRVGEERAAGLENDLAGVDRIGVAAGCRADGDEAQYPSGSIAPHRRGRTAHAEPALRTFFRTTQWTNISPPNSPAWMLRQAALRASRAMPAQPRAKREFCGKTASRAGTICRDVGRCFFRTDRGTECASSGTKLRKRPLWFPSTDADDQQSSLESSYGLVSSVSIGAA
jgi:hypothetical protein